MTSRSHRGSRSRRQQTPPRPVAGGENSRSQRSVSATCADAAACAAIGSRALIASTITRCPASLAARAASYVLTRFEFGEKAVIVAAFLVTQMIPAFIALGPLYMLMTNLGLVDSKGGLTLVHIAMLIPFSTIMLRGFFENIPDTLEEAAMIDGCSRLGALFRVLVPSCSQA